MKTTYYDSENLRKARALHDEALRLHLAPPAIVTWGAKIYEPSGEQVEEILAKSNSYTRNGLNLIAAQSTYIARNTGATVGVIGGGFSDGTLGCKNTDGTVRSNLSDGIYQSEYGQSTTTGESVFSLLAGYSDSPESIDSYALGSEYGSGSGVNQLNKGVSAKNSVWDSANRKFVTTFSRQFSNGYGSSQIIKEIGLMIAAKIALSAATPSLMLRDVLASPITLASGQTVILYYQLEASIPSA